MERGRGLGLRMSKHLHKRDDTMNEKKSLRDKALDWINKNVPVYSRAEYEALMLTNEALILRLIAKCIDYYSLM